MMAEEARQEGARLLIVTLSNAVQVHPDQQLRENTRNLLQVEDFLRPERTFQEIGERSGIEVLNLAPPMLQYAEQEQVHLHGFGNRLGLGHWNEEGHRVAGGILARWIMADL